MIIEPFSITSNGIVSIRNGVNTLGVKTRLKFIVVQSKHVLAVSI